MAEYWKDDDLKALGEKVIAANEKLEHLNSPSCRIAYQYSSQEKKSNKKTTYADTERIKDKLKAFLPYDFIITFYQPNTVELDAETMERLMYHELCHVGYDEDSGAYSIIPHDVEDFRDVIEHWGLDWINS